MDNQTLNKVKELRNKYPWLKITTKIEDYVEPDYYDKLLKEYSFDGKTDIDIFKKELLLIRDKSNASVLELGCGTGRGTQIVLNDVNFKKLTLVDLSKDMIKKSSLRFKDVNNINIVQSDTLNFLKSTEDKYDFAFSLWSFSHSVYQMIERLGYEKGVEEVKRIIHKFFTENMETNARFYLIHSDWKSDEQKILVRQWSRDLPELYGHGKQGISKIILDSIFEDLEKEKLVEWSVEHCVGDAIEYSSLDQAMETFINFHLESYFNDTKYLPEVVEDLENYLSKFVGQDGKVRVKPACFMYRCMFK